MAKDTVRIGNAGGYWGDDPQAMERQLDGGELDYITSDFLAEVTMGILMKEKLRDGRLGYVHDFLDQLEPLLGALARRGVRIVTNAGGLAPGTLAEKIAQAVRRRGLALTVACVEGDDLTGRVDELYPDQERFANLETGEELAAVRERLLSANAYFGIPGILDALRGGAHIVITGRVGDPAVALAPMVHELGWALDDWDRLAAGVAAGHIIECGGQATGGNFTDWERVPSWSRLGFPIVEMRRDGSFLIRKHPGSGGLLDCATVAEQVVYELGDPRNYVSPDVVADLSGIRLEDRPEGVLVRGIRGRPPTSRLKVSMSYADGWRACGSILVGGRNLGRKAAIFEQILRERVGSPPPRRLQAELLGGTGPSDPDGYGTALLQFCAWDGQPSAVERFSRAISTLILSGPAGAAVTGGRPRPQQVVAYWPALIDKKRLSCRVRLLAPGGRVEEHDGLPPAFFPAGIGEDGARESAAAGAGAGASPPGDAHGGGLNRTAGPQHPAPTSPPAGRRKVRLAELCLARSGDKGDTATIGVVARGPEAYRFLKASLTAAAVRRLFADVCRGEVVRYELDGILALNFLLHRALDGGGARSLRADAQGKLLAQRLLEERIPVDERTFARLRPPGATG